MLVEVSLNETGASLPPRLREHLRRKAGKNVRCGEAFCERYVLCTWCGRGTHERTSVQGWAHQILSCMAWIVSPPEARPSLRGYSQLMVAGEGGVIFLSAGLDTSKVNNPSLMAIAAAPTKHVHT